MKRFGFLILAICLIGAGCDDDNPASPSAPPWVFSALLSPANEVPAVANVESSGSGATQITIHTTRNAAGAVTAATADFHVQLYGFPGDTRIQGAHIHSAVAGVNGPIRVDTGATAASAVPLADGGVSYNVVGITVDPAVAEQIAANPSAWYFNVHSPRNPGGFARGQLARVR